MPIRPIHPSSPDGGTPPIPVPAPAGPAHLSAFNGPIDVVGAAIVDDARSPRRLLAARRAPGERHAGRWELPGGKVDEGEELTAALAREIREELGVTARLLEPVPGPLPDGWWPLPLPEVGTAYRMAVWLATVDAPPRAVEGHDELRWLAREELHSVEWLPGDLPIVAALAERLTA